MEVFWKPDALSAHGGIAQHLSTLASTRFGLRLSTNNCQVEAIRNVAVIGFHCCFFSINKAYKAKVELHLKLKPTHRLSTSLSLAKLDINYFISSSTKVLSHLPPTLTQQPSCKPLHHPPPTTITKDQPPLHCRKQEHRQPWQMPRLP